MTPKLTLMKNPKTWKCRKILHQISMCAVVYSPIETIILHNAYFMYGHDIDKIDHLVIYSSKKITKKFEFECNFLLIINGLIT